MFPEFQVNTETVGNQFDSSVPGLMDGGFVVTWTSRDQDGRMDGIFGQRYDAAGAAIGTEFLINTTTQCTQMHPSVTGMDDGGFVVTWDSDGQGGSGGGIFGRRYDAAGATRIPICKSRPSRSYSSCSCCI